MPRTLGVSTLALAISVVIALAASAPALAAPPINSALVGTPIRSVFVRAPQRGVTPGKPVQVLVALHGMGGNGEAFSNELFEQADRYGWLIVAPTIDYGDWTKPEVVAREEPVLIRALLDYVDQLPSTGTPVRRTLMLLGHSRGAQLAHRFAEFRPERVLAVAALSAGTYTLPKGTLSFPFGVRDLATYAGSGFDAARIEHVQFWVGVGGLDTNPGDLPRQWDSYQGTTRLQRAQAFAAAMQSLGASSVLRVFAGARHEVTTEMRSTACAFLAGAMFARTPRGTPLTAAPIRY